MISLILVPPSGGKTYMAAQLPDLITDFDDVVYSLGIPTSGWLSSRSERTSSPHDVLLARRILPRVRTPFLAANLHPAVLIDYLCMDYVNQTVYGVIPTPQALLTRLASRISVPDALVLRAIDNVLQEADELRRLLLAMARPVFTSADDFLASIRKHHYSQLAKGAIIP